MSNNRVFYVCEKVCTCQAAGIDFMFQRYKGEKRFQGRVSLSPSTREPAPMAIREKRKGDITKMT